ncbi:MAG: RES family NAD+ phosphorylase [Euryarchaeota archaeon]|nr:RES family NAD+ phosphorylase [Euryarchaeota archaeon]
MRVWRVHDQAFAADAWTGEGARLHGGRWNPPGVTVVYASEHAALAILEVLAGNLRDVDLKHFRLHGADVPDGLIHDLPAGTSEHARAAAWLAAGTLACRVPSAVAPGTNILLNPLSADWHRVTMYPPVAIDPRLYGRG